MKVIRKMKQTIKKCIALFCITALLLFALAGCSAPYDPSEDIDALRDEFTEQIDELKAENAAAQSEISALKEAYDAALLEIESLKSANISTKQTLSTLKANYETALQKINELKNSCDTEDRDLSELLGSYTELQAELDELKISYTETKATLDALEESYAEIQAELEGLQSGDNTPSAEIEALRADYEAAMLEIEQLKAQIESLVNTLDPPKIKIYIDQGHNPTGYYNAGAAGNGIYEQDVTFAIGKQLANLLISDGRFEICLSRPTTSTVLGTDSQSSLDARVAGATEFGAGFFISLHTNSYDSPDANGIEVHVTEESGDSFNFGAALLDGMIESTGLRNRGMKISPNLYVIKNATMPAALLEMGFISNEGDAALLAESQNLFAEGIYAGILSYFNLPAANS